jgi:hypothetical protein
MQQSQNSGTQKTSSSAAPLPAPPMKTSGRQWSTPETSRCPKGEIRAVRKSLSDARELEPEARKKKQARTKHWCELCSWRGRRIRDRWVAFCCATTERAETLPEPRPHTRVKIGGKTRFWWRGPRDIERARIGTGISDGKKKMWVHSRSWAKPELEISGKTGTASKTITSNRVCDTENEKQVSKETGSSRTTGYRRTTSTGLKTKQR